jgi:hypothetical protein
MLCTVWLWTGNDYAAVLCTPSLTVALVEVHELTSAGELAWYECPWRLR